MPKLPSGRYSGASETFTNKDGSTTTYYYSASQWDNIQMGRLGLALLFIIILAPVAAAIVLFLPMLFSGNRERGEWIYYVCSIILALYICVDYSSGWILSVFTSFVYSDLKLVFCGSVAIILVDIWRIIDFFHDPRRSQWIRLIETAALVIALTLIFTGLGWFPSRLDPKSPKYYKKELKATSEVPSEAIPEEVASQSSISSSGISTANDLNEEEPIQDENYAEQSGSLDADDYGTDDYGMSGNEDINDGTKSLFVLPVQMNVLYRGVDNHVEIAIQGSEVQNVTAQGGVISGPISNGIYTVRPGDGNQCSISATVTTNGMDVQMTPRIFRIKRIPNPVASFGGKKSYDSVIDLNSATTALGVRADMEAFDFPVSTSISSFNVILIMNGQNKEYKCGGNRLSTEAIESIKKLQRGDRIIIEEISCLMPDNTERKLSPIALKIQ